MSAFEFNRTSGRRWNRVHITRRLGLFEDRQTWTMTVDEAIELFELLEREIGPEIFAKRAEKETRI